MKKIFSILLYATLLLAFSPLAISQVTKAGEEEEFGPYSIKGQIQDPDIQDELTDEQKIIRFPKDNGIQGNTDFAYSKNISAPFSDGTYWIKLESYSTGTASSIKTSAPADIVLVLDLSSSMVNNGISVQTPTGGWTYNSISTGGPYHFQYNNALYEVEQYSTGGRYYLRFNTGGNNWRYLTGDTSQRNQPNNAPQNANTAIYTGTLYGESRLEALKRATNAFIDVIDHNDQYEDETDDHPRMAEDGVTRTRLGNRISIITFWSEANVRVTLQKGTLSDTSDDTHSTAAELKQIVSNFTNGSGTRPDLGIDQANDQFTRFVDEERRATASRTVVVFTDGEPYPNTNNANYTSAIAAARTSKVTHEATVFTVGLFSSTPTTTSDLYRFMNYMSSNAPNATSFTNAGDDYDTTAGYYKDASSANADLTAVFTEIAKQSGGSQASLSAASSNVDVISNSFVLPDYVDASTVQDEVKIFFAKVNNQLTKDNGGVLVFDEEVIKEHSTYTYQPLNEDGSIMEDTDPRPVTATVSMHGENGIKVTGFDYSSCFCGSVTDEYGNVTYQGYKIIVMIPILANDDAVGGPNVDTNAPGSGIYVTDGATEAYVAYNSPTVSLPYNIFIQKEGLEPGESAKFKLERAFMPDPVPAGWAAADIPESSWTYVSTIFVTQPMGDTTSKPIVKVRGLPSTDDNGDYVYRVTEETWTWSYHRPGPQYTDKSKVDNPFYFVNTPKENIDQKLRHAESKATNVFNGSTTKAVYEDSKNNTSSTGGNRYQ